MRRFPLVVVALLLALSWPVESAPSPPPGPFVPHAPIRILQDADFNQTNGVVAGTGTPSDPYVIAGWRIRNDVGAAIRIENVTAKFVVRHNLLEGRIGVALDRMSSIGTVTDNQVHASFIGIEIKSSDAYVGNNSIFRLNDHVSARGVVLSGSSSTVELNYILTFGNGIEATGGSPRIHGNDIHQAATGIYVASTAAANVTANVVTVPIVAGIYLKTNIFANVSANIVNGSAGTGIEVWVDKDLGVRNNTVRYSTNVGIAIESSSGVVDGNLVVDGRADAVIVWHSPVLVANNTVHNNLGVGLHFSNSAADAEANLVSRNGVGIALTTSEAVRLKANVLVNNTVGVSIPYEARLAIAHLEANLVNGVNIDGRLNASQQVFFYKAANVSITGQVRDSGFSAGYYGSLTAQGGVVLYEVDTANVNATILSHHNVGVGIVNSFNVNVDASLLANNLIGVRAEARAMPFQVPNCVVSVKRTNITIEVDPVATFGIDTRGCGTFVSNTTVSLVDTGVRVTGSAAVGLANVTVHSTSFVGLDLSSSGVTNVSGGAIVGNRLGVRVGGGHEVTIQDLDISRNHGPGIRLDAGSRVQLLGNHIHLNGEGVVDTQACLGAGSCAVVQAEGNLIELNRGDGLRVNGTSTLRGDVLVGNLGTGARLGSATLLDVQALANGGSGASVAGAFRVQDSRFEANARHGFELVGEGSLRASTFRWNGEAGIRARATYVTAYGLNVSSNFDGILFEEAVSTSPRTPGTSVPGLLQVLPVHALTGTPLDIHLSTLLDNRRDAVRAGGAPVNASHNYWGPLGPTVNVLDTVGAYQNGVTPTVRTVPFYTTPDMREESLTRTDSAPAPAPPGASAPATTALTVYHDDFGWCAAAPCAAASADATNRTGSALANVTYDTSGAAPWLVMAEGIDGNGMAARSGNVTTGQTSDLAVRLTVPQGERAGFFYEFRYRVRGAPENATTLDGDTFRFHVERFVRDPQTGQLVSADSAECLRTVGSRDWTLYDSRRALGPGADALCAHLPPGDYVLRFRFERDTSAGVAGSGAWLDHLQVDRRPQLG